MDEISSLKNSFVKNHGKKVMQYLNSSKYSDLKFLKYYQMNNTNFYFSKEKKKDFLYKNLIYLDGIFLKNIFFYYKQYFTSAEIEFLCKNCQENIYIYLKEQDLPEKGNIDRIHMINRVNFLFPIFFHSTSYEFYSNARCSFQLDKELIKYIKKYNKKSFHDKQKILLKESFNMYSLGLLNQPDIKTSNNFKLCFDNNDHYYFFGIKVIDYPYLLNDLIINLPSVKSAYYIILYYTRLRLNKSFYTINQEFLQEIVINWKMNISRLKDFEIKELKRLTNYNYNFILNLFKNMELIK